MERINRLFLEALRASLNDASVSWEEEISGEEWLALFRLAQTHSVLPLIYEAAYASPAARHADPQLMAAFKRQTMQSVMLQAVKTRDFLRLFHHLESAGLTPVVVKGIVCRSLYAKPDCRMSGDEDVLIPPEQFRACHEALTAFGMQPSQPEKDLEAEYEVPYGKPGSPLYIELHKSLFPPDSEAYGELNRCFAGAMERTAQLQIDGTSIRTLGATDHFLYLILHSFKHFLHSGFGIRQVCDIVLFANRYGSEIDWERILECCREIHADVFTAALLRIGERYLTFQPDAAHYPQAFRAIEVDEGDMLEDLLAAGVYGDASMSRKHSSNITLDAVSAQKKGKQGGHHVLKTLFPPAKSLASRYPYLKKRPYLLPVAWIDRILKYGWEIAHSHNNDAAESVRIGSERVELMKKYGVIK